MIFAGATLDRAPLERKRPEWLAEQRSDPRARAILMSERGIWIDGSRLLLAPPTDDAAFLGLAGETPLFADDVSGAEPAEGRPAGLREAATELPAEEVAFAGYAGSLLAWHRRHRFCANCGAPTEVREGGHVRHCPSCGAEHHPRTDPVVIMLVLRGDEVLLGRQASWPRDRYSALAGFVEPGESLEEAVAREVLEESGVRIGPPRYVSSQPWPFPASLMLGFVAPWDSGEPRIGDEELEDVCWFSRKAVEDAVRERGPLRLPPPLAIARQLIDGWLES